MAGGKGKAPASASGGKDDDGKGDESTATAPTFPGDGGALVTYLESHQCDDPSVGSPHDKLGAFEELLNKLYDFSSKKKSVHVPVKQATQLMVARFRQLKEDLIDGLNAH